MRISADIDLFTSICGENHRWAEMVIHMFLEAVIFANSVMLRCQPQILPMYAYAKQGKIKYKRMPPGDEVLAGISAILREGGGDCDRLCAWRIAELRVRGSEYYPNGEPAKLRLIRFDRPGKPLLYHVQVERAPTPQQPQGWIEDPSRLLGMTGAG